MTRRELLAAAAAPAVAPAKLALPEKPEPYNPVRLDITRFGSGVSAHCDHPGVPWCGRWSGSVAADLAWVMGGAFNAALEDGVSVVVGLPLDIPLGTLVCAMGMHAVEYGNLPVVHVSVPTPRGTPGLFDVDVRGKVVQAYEAVLA